MNRLPTELVREIFSYLTRYDALDARLVSRQLATSLAPLAFRRFNLYFIPFSLGRLVDLAHSHCGKYVREIHVFTQQLPADDVSAMRRQLSTPSCGIPAMSETHIPAALSIFEQLKQEQSTMIFRQSYHALLKEAFVALPNLDAIVVTTFPGDDDHVPLGHAYSSRSIALIQHYIMAAGALNQVECQHMYPRIATAMLSAMAYRAVHLTNSHIRHLTLQKANFILHSPAWQDKLDADAFKGGVREALQTVMEHLETFELDTNCDFSPEACISLQRLLKSCTQLRSLTLRVTKKHRFLETQKLDVNTAPWSNLFDSPRAIWPRLHTLVTDCNLRNKDMIKFMNGRRHTLKYLTLSTNYFNDFREVLQEIPKHLELEQINLMQLIDWDKDFVEHQGWEHTYFPRGLDLDFEVTRSFLLRKGEAPSWQPERLNWGPDILFDDEDEDDDFGFDPFD